MESVISTGFSGGFSGKGFATDVQNRSTSTDSINWFGSENARDWLEFQSAETKNARSPC